jgi:hypothetical protein
MRGERKSPPIPRVKPALSIGCFRAFYQSLISPGCFGVLRALFEGTGGQQLPRANAAFGEELFEGSAAGGIWFARGVVICKGGGCSICADSQGRF